MDIAAVCTIDLAALLAVHDIDRLTMIRARQASGADVLLLVPVREPDTRSSLARSGHAPPPLDG